MNNNPMHNLAAVMTEKFIAAAPQAAAQALAVLATHEVILLVGGLKAQSLIAVLNPMDAPKAAAVLRRLPLKQACYVLTHLDVLQAAKLWKEFATPYQERLKSVLSPAFVQLVQTAGGFEPGSVGNVMCTDFVAVRTENKVAELVARLKNLPRKKLPLACFVTGRNDELKGVILTAELAFFNPQAVCGSVMTKTACALKPQDTLAVAQTLFNDEETAVLPVVNEGGILIGSLDKMAALTAAPAKKTLWDKFKK
ncbi:MAG: magnesium transporter [Elusimicrobiaceae bacterium]|nr:magnesium transporter [Elusimicrobiaceae bacterium]